MILEHNKLWKRIKQLEGEIVYTVKRQSPNKIIEVNDKYVKIAGKTPVAFNGEKGIYAVYDRLIKKGELTGKNLYGRWVIPGILFKALIGEVDILPKGEGIAFKRSVSSVKTTKKDLRHGNGTRYWLTFHDPMKNTQDEHEGVWVHPGWEHIASEMNRGDQVLIYETVRDREDRSNKNRGASAVVALVEVTRKVKGTGKGKWVRVAHTKPIDEGHCSEADLKKVLRKDNGTRYKRFQSFGPGSNHLKEISEEEFDAIAAYFPGYEGRYGDQIDIDGSAYQRKVEKASPRIPSKIPQKPEYVTQRGRQKLKLKPEIAAYCLKQAKYKCGVDVSHTTFISRITANNYVEAHHLVPLRYQYIFRKSLDNPANIIALCPNCHRLLHHATSVEKQGCLRKLFDVPRKRLLKSMGIDVAINRLFGYYEV